MPTSEYPVTLKEVVSKSGSGPLYEGDICDTNCVKILRGLMRVTRRLQLDRYDLRESDYEERSTCMSRGKPVKSENFPSLLYVLRLLKIQNRNAYLTFFWKFTEYGSSKERWNGSCHQTIYLSPLRDGLVADGDTYDAWEDVVGHYGKLLKNPNHFGELVAQCERLKRE